MSSPIIEILPVGPDEPSRCSVIVNGQHIRHAVEYAQARFVATAIRDAFEVIGVTSILSDILGGPPPRKGYYT